MIENHNPNDDFKYLESSIKWFVAIIIGAIVALCFIVGYLLFSLIS